MADDDGLLIKLPNNRRKLIKITYLEVLPLLHFNYSAINPVAVKTLAAALGLPAGPFRRPLKPLDPIALQAGLDIVRDLGLAEKYGYSLNRGQGLRVAQA